MNGSFSANFSLEKEIIADRNCGVGLVVAANHVAMGLILYGVISGEGGGLAALLVFWPWARPP